MFGAVLEACIAEVELRGREFSFGLIDLAGCVAVHDEAIVLLVAGDIAFTLLPSGGGAEDHAIPVVVEEAFVIFFGVPNGIELARCAKTLAVSDEPLDVEQAFVVVGVDAAPVIDARGDPGLDARIGEGANPLFIALWARTILPRNGNHIFGKILDQLGVLHRNIAPRRAALM